jgi:hypothetical protein
MEIKMKKVIHYLIFFSVFAIIGGISGVIISKLQIDTLLFSKIHVKKTLVLFILSILSSVTLHELAHAIYFLLNKVPLRFVAIFIFFFCKTERKWTVRIRFNNITIMGGIAIPNLPSINNEREFDRIRKIYSEALLFAPVISFAEAVIFIILYVVLFLTKTVNEYVNLSIFSVFCSFIGIIIVFSSFIKTENIYGDFWAYKVLKTDDKMASLQLCQYMFFNTDWKMTVSKSTWLIKKLMDYAKEIKVTTTELIDLKILDWIIQMEYLGVVKPDKEILEILKEFFLSDNVFSNYPPQEDRDVFYFHMIYKLLGSGVYEKSILQEKMNVVSSKLLAGSPSKEYYTKLTEHLFGYECSEWLLRNKNPNSTYSLLKEFEAIHEIEEKIILQNTMGKGQKYVK